MLFQCFAGLSLANRHRVPLCLNIRRQIEVEGWDKSRLLGLLNELNLRFETSDENYDFTKVLGALRLNNIFGITQFYEEADAGFDPLFFELPKTSMIMGYFQSPRYFEPIREEARRMLDGASCEILKRFAVGLDSHNSENSVAVHVRRGDYLSGGFHVSCGKNYFVSAMDKMREEIFSPKFYVFTDDITWCRGNFYGPDISISSSGDSGDAILDFILMSRCRHHIISSSTFSWWAAWMGESDGQIVVAPSIWSRRSPDNEYAQRELVSKSWIRLNPD